MKNNRLRFLLFLSILIVIAFLPSFPATAAETADGEVVPCDVPCYVISDDPAGVKVRSGPGDSYPSSARSRPTRRRS